MINFFSEGVAMPKLDMAGIKNVLNKVILENSFSEGEINYIFCSDTYLLSLNNEFLNHDYYTDIITFDYSENNFVSGDVFISLDRVQDNSAQFRCEFIDELNRVILHGVLHMIKKRVL